MLGMIDRIHIKKGRSSRKGSYGFISAYDGETYWFKYREEDDLKVGDEVSFTGGFNDKGYVARYVKKIGEEDRF